MDKRPPVKPGDRISIGSDFTFREAIVSRVYTNEEWLDRVQVVYLDNKSQAMADNVCWDGTSWKFVTPDPSGSYADNIPELKRYAEILYTERSARKRRRPRRR